MQDLSDIEQRFTELLGLSSRPIAISFSDQPLQDGEIHREPQPAGCSFWQLAANGQSVRTAPEDHYNCAIGCHTHNIPLPDERKDELEASLGLMTQHQYISMNEVPDIPRLKQTPASVVYAPLAESAQFPDVVLVRGSTRSVMLLQEAAQHAGVQLNGNLLGRPTCMALPAALAGGVISSLGCIGNRIYTQLTDGEMYVAFPGTVMNDLATSLTTIASANEAVGQWHEERSRAINVG